MTKAVELRDIRLQREGRMVLEDVSATFSPGTFTAVLGPNGVGKTTLLDVMTGCVKPEGGFVNIFGRPLKELGARALAKQVAVVAQRYEVPFGFCVKDVVMTGRHPHIGRFQRPGPCDMAAVDAAMEAADLGSLSNRSILAISGGEVQRTFFARALAQSTPVLILDEATSNLDIRHSLSLLATVRHRVQTEGLTAVGVFQDINMAALFCDRFLLLKQGRVVADGSRDAVLTAKTLSEVFDVAVEILPEEGMHPCQVLYLDPSKGSPEDG